MKHALVALAVAPLLLSACVVVDPGPMDQTDQCRRVGPAVSGGQARRAAGRDALRQEVRVIQYGMAVTMDYRPYRLNIWLNDRDVIERVTCG